MKILLLILIIPTITFAQTWAPVGATWTYTQPTINPYYKTYTTFESVADTIVSGQNCQKIVETFRKNPSIADTIEHFMYSDNNQVYFFANNSWNLLYDFNVQQGDSFLVGYYDQWVKIISVDTISINGHQRKHFEYDAPGMINEFSGTVIEGIGHVDDMFPTGDGQYYGPLRCYKDDLVGLYKSEYYYGSTWAQDCNQITTGIDNKIDDKKVRIFPNPFTDKITFTSSSKEQSTVLLYNVFGLQVLEQNFLNSIILNTEQLSSGVYFYNLRCNRQTINKGKIIKH